MDFALSDKVKHLQRRLQAFMDEYIYPNERRYYDEIERNRWSPPTVIEEIKPKARAAGLWNLFLPARCAWRGVDESRICSAVPKLWAAAVHGS